MTTKLDDIFAEMHLEMAKELLKKIKDGSATAADLSVARQFLKDNNISGVPAKDTPLGSLVQSLPFTGEEEETKFPH